jgi:hypothetical protein
MLQPITFKKSRKRLIKLNPHACRNPKSWVWPLPEIDGSLPRVLSHANDERLAIELGYADRTADSLVPVYAIHEGTIVLARETVSGFAMSIDHHGEWSSHYAKLDQMAISPIWDEARPKHRVRAGQIIGYTTRIAPIRFELWRWTDEHGFVPTPPEPRMSNWLVLCERDPHPANTQPNQAANDKVAA